MMDLTNQTQIQIKNKVFTLGSPVTHVDTLDKLLEVFQQEGIDQRPIVIINPVNDAIPDLTNLLENYIENSMQGTYTTSHVTYLFQDATDDELLDWAKSQYKNGGNQTLDYLFEVGKTIRTQSQFKRELDSANARRDELWRLHCLNPESNAGSEEYANLTYTVVPQIEAKIKEVTEYLDKIPKNLNTGLVQDVPVPVVPEPEVNTPEPVVVEQVASTSIHQPNLVMLRSSNLLMPLSIAKQLVDAPQNQAFKAQQEMQVEGYDTVPLEYLIALGVSLYADGVPIVYTKSGTFRRVGNSSISPLTKSYWYPTPRYQ